MKTQFNKLEIEIKNRGKLESKLQESDNKIRLLIAEVEKLSLAYNDKISEVE